MSQGWRRTPLPADWAPIRRRILQRDPQCTLRLDVCTGTSTEVDHIDQPDNHHDTNLRGVCNPCHWQRTRQQQADALRTKAAARRRPTEPHPGLTRGGG